MLKIRYSDVYLQFYDPEAAIGMGVFSGSSSQMLEEWGISNNYQYVNENRTVTVILK